VLFKRSMKSVSQKKKASSSSRSKNYYGLNGNMKKVANVANSNVYNFK